ncbi:uncharacterized protein [Henckelia pumila]|uniref:uncharacterized protein n=1 Tax=Henckelia pumila TaxID=405737 RepID=UPI003C6DEC13
MDVPFANTSLQPLILDGTNYALWKVKIKVYIKSIDEKSWQRVVDGWNPPRKIDADSDRIVKLATEWTSNEVQVSNFNFKALNAIFTFVDTNMFNLIANCICAKKAWEILQKHCEGSESLRRAKVRMLTSKFESLRMEGSEIIIEYDRRLRDIANEAFSLGDPISNERLVSKVLRSLPERFNIKICAIDTAKDTSKLALMSSLRTFEMNMDSQKKDKCKSIAFQVSNDLYSYLLQLSQEFNESDLSDDSISLITKKLEDYLKRIRDKKKVVQKSKLSSLTAPEKPQRVSPNRGQSRPRYDGKNQTNANRYDFVQCKKCTGYGHYANECPNRLRKCTSVFFSDI